MQVATGKLFRWAIECNIHYTLTIFVIFYAPILCTPCISHLSKKKIAFLIFYAPISCSLTIFVAMSTHNFPVNDVSSWCFIKLTSSTICSINFLYSLYPSLNLMNNICNLLSQDFESNWVRLVITHVVQISGITKEEEPLNFW
jgi:hypothetical protein